MNRYIAILLLSTGMSCALSAATFTVTNFNDAGAGSLRQAIIDANAQAVNDLIVFDPALALQYPHTMVLQTPLPDIENWMEVRGPGSGQLTLRRDPSASAFRILTVAPAALVGVTISGFTLENGLLDEAAGIDAEGGGLYGSANVNLELEDIVVRGCIARSAANSAGDCGHARGGGIHLERGGALVNVTIEDCSAEAGDSSSNRGGDAEGGGLYVGPNGNRSLSQVRILNCHAVAGSGVIGSGGGGDARGGGAYYYRGGAADLQVEDCSCTGGFGSGDARGGGVLVESWDAGDVFLRVAIRNCTAQAGASPGGTIWGGGVYGGGLNINTVGDPVLEDIEIAGREAIGGNHPTTATQNGYAYGAALMTSSSGSITIDRAYIHGCVVTSGTVPVRAAVRISCDATIRTTTIANNDGTGIHIDGSGKFVIITQCTIHGNAGTGGGVYSPNNSTLVLNGVTVTANHAQELSQVGGVFSNGNAYLGYCIVASNVTAGLTSSPDLGGSSSYPSPVHNLIRIGGGYIADGTDGNQVGAVGAAIDPDLGALDDNGGFAPTRMPNSGSPAINAGGAAGTGSATEDQRGAPRFVGGGTPALRDVGAVEYDGGTRNLNVATGALDLDSANPVGNYSMSGNNLSGPVRVVAPAGFLVSDAASGPFTQEVQFMPAGTGGTLGVTVYVQWLELGGTSSGKLSHESTQLPAVEKDVTGTYIAPPFMELRTSPGGTVLPRDGSQSLGVITTGQAQLQGYSIHNLGAQDLQLIGTPAVGFLNEVNCTVAIVSAPSGSVAQGTSTTFSIEVTPTADGPFSFTLLVDSNDPVGAFYTVDVDGEASPTPPGGGDGGGNGGSDDSCSTSSGTGSWLLALALLCAVGVTWRARRA